MKGHKPIMAVVQFIPLLTVLMIIVVLVAIKQSFAVRFQWHEAMLDFMGIFFLFFGMAKLMNWHSFINMYQQYDIIAQQSSLYAAIYPFIEISLGIAFLFRIKLVLINIITLILMLISSVGVMKTVLQGKSLTCACLGGIFNLPISTITLAEDLLMALMALLYLIA
jgi:hypothetical protein